MTADLLFIPYTPPTICPLCGYAWTPGLHMQWLDRAAGELPAFGCVVPMLCSYPQTLGVISSLDPPTHAPSNDATGHSA